MLSVKNLSSGYSAVQVLHDVNLTIRQGDRLALVGPNGAGKTTLLETISGFVQVHSGDILLDGHSVAGFRPDMRALAGLSIVTEKRNLFPQMTVLENLKLGRYAAPELNRWAKADVNSALERVFRLFPKLKDLQKRRVSVMSGGEQQMVAVGRALMAEPKILMLDEPSQGLAPRLIEAMYQAIESMGNEIGVFLVEQNIEVVKSVTRNVYLMLDGRIRPLEVAEIEDEHLMIKEVFGEL